MKASHLRTPRDLESAFGVGIVHHVVEQPARRKRPTRGQQMLKAAVIAVGTVAGTLFVLYLMAGPL
jgi:hypothetical protein